MGAYPGSHFTELPERSVFLGRHCQWPRNSGVTLHATIGKNIRGGLQNNAPAHRSLELNLKISAFQKKALVATSTDERICIDQR